ncbi:MAG: ATP-binding cassette domain-containing protein [Synergistaceae bacterium]|nr:ATP-binding cassette domain-containing protein [Synergistaceae bacterium]
MYLLKAANIKLSYGGRTIIDVESLELLKGQKIGLVGSNGAGKSTLLSVLSGRVVPDEGTVDARAPIALISQDDGAPSAAPAKGADRALSRTGRSGGGAFECRPLSERPSGGEVERDKIALALSSDADVLMADEPTTNLDSEGIENLERELMNFSGGLILVSHDREMLDRVCGAIWEIECGRVRAFPGNYSAWRQQRERERKFALLEYERYGNEERRLRDAAREAIARSARATRPPSRMSLSEARINPDKGQIGQAKIASRAGALRKRAAMLESRERPECLPEIRMTLGSGEGVVSPSIIRISGLSVAFGDRVVFDEARCEVATGKRTALLGPNGSGKTTLIEAIAAGGECVKIAPRARVGYFDQRRESLDMEKSALDNARALSSLPEHEVRTILARLEIKGLDARKRCGILSGGERTKVMLARLMASDLNALILDEPTNHMDLYTMDELESLLRSWRGTLLFASHDRRLVENVAERLLIIEDKKIRTFEGTPMELAEHAAAHGKEGCAPKSPGMTESMMDMRLAELSSKLASAKTEGERRAIASSLEALTSELSRLKRRST